MDRQSPSLVKLPSELILQICSHIYDGARREDGLFGKDWDEDRKDLCALLRTNRRLHSIATPILYTHLFLYQYLRWETPGQVWTSTNATKRTTERYLQPGQLKKLIATFERNPLLAGLVRSICYDEDCLFKDDSLKGFTTLFAKLLTQTTNVSMLEFWDCRRTLPTSFGFQSAPGIQKLVCNTCWLSIDFVRQFPQLRVLTLTDLCEIQKPEGEDYGQVPPWEHAGVEELRLNVKEDQMIWYHWILKRFPSLTKLRIGDYKSYDCEHMPLLENLQSRHTPLLENLQSRHTPLRIYRLLGAIQKGCPSIEILHLAELLPLVFEVKHSDGPAPISMLPFPEFPNLTHLALSSHYLDYDSGENPLITVCRNCPRLQSLELYEVQIHGLEFCDNLLKFAGYIAKARQLGHDFAVYLKSIEVDGDWVEIDREKSYPIWREHDSEEQLKCLKWNYTEYWMSISERWAAHPHASVFRSSGISYNERLKWPWTGSGEEIHHRAETWCARF